ncbi:hypothetical protein [Indioceanicola profundi]|uniref:hypothetical protein n=1 Tax=Indioceanicola profundi TaxID=2220096 RepID=UPI000E6ABCAA|nr:hypothetical protein [Indioceanicola profundi]
MAFDGALSVEGRAGVQDRPGDPVATRHAAAVPLDRLPFVGLRGDGQKSYWVMPRLAEGESQQLRARTYAAWFLIYAEANGPAARKWLLDRIEREMPSRYPGLDRIFLSEVSGRF